VNVISPGPIETPIFDGQFSTKQAADAFREQFKANVPLQRLGLPEEVASAALFLASNESSYITGIDLPVDGRPGVGLTSRLAGTRAAMSKLVVVKERRRYRPAPLPRWTRVGPSSASHELRQNISRAGSIELLTVPMKRFAQPLEVAAAIAAAFITGQTIFGGRWRKTRQSRTTC
jgi:NAD(P)-dependent dehydrogenase (short-subunit alcohol dehydrogenase family)